MLIPLSFLLDSMATGALGLSADVAAGAGIQHRAYSRVAGESSRLRENFDPAVVWIGEHICGPDGILSTSFSLPDSLTSYRIVAVAADTQGNFGLGRRSIVAGKALQLVPALPRFLTSGDRFEARVLVQNTSNASGLVTVTAESAELGLGGEQREVAVPAGSSALVAFEGHAGNSGSARIVLSADMATDSGTLHDSMALRLPILPDRPLITVAASGTIAAGRTATLPLDLSSAGTSTAGESGTPLLDPRSRLSLTLSASPAAGTLPAALHVLEYPWECLEQRLSKAFVRLLRIQYASMLGLEPDDKDRSAVESIFQTLDSAQHYEGGFPLWKEGIQGDIYVTAYALLVDREARKLGMGLDPETRSQAEYWLQRALEARYVTYPALAAQSGKEVDEVESIPGVPSLQQAPSSEADCLALWLLADSNSEAAASLFEPMLAYAENAQGKMSPMAWAALALADAVAHRATDSVLRARILPNLEKSAVITPTQMHFAPVSSHAFWRTFGSGLRDNAFVLAALSMAAPDYPRLDALAAWVGQGLGERPVPSTQEGALGLYGMASYLIAHKGTGTAAMEAVFDATHSIEAAFARPVDPPLIWTVPAAALQGSSSHTLALKATAGKPSWTARLSYASPHAPLQAEHAGMSVTRSLAHTGTLRAGDTVEATVTVIVPEIRRHVAVFDPFPAGMETAYASRVDLSESAMSLGYPWQRRDVYDHGVLLYAEEILPGVYTYKYTLRAVTPGRFLRAPSHAEEMYTPEVYGRSALDIVDILP